MESSSGATATATRLTGAPVEAAKLSSHFLHNLQQQTKCTGPPTRLQQALCLALDSFEALRMGQELEAPRPEPVDFVSAALALHERLQGRQAEPALDSDGLASLAEALEGAACFARDSRLGFDNIARLVWLDAPGSPNPPAAELAKPPAAAAAAAPPPALPAPPQAADAQHTQAVYLLELSILDMLRSEPGLAADLAAWLLARATGPPPPPPPPPAMDWVAKSLEAERKQQADISLHLDVLARTLRASPP